MRADGHLPSNANRSFHSVFHRLGRGETARSASRQVSQNQELTESALFTMQLADHKPVRPQMARGPRSNRTGNSKSALKKPSTPVTAMPKMRNGRVTSHTKG